MVLEIGAKRTKKGSKRARMNEAQRKSTGGYRKEEKERMWEY